MWRKIKLTLTLIFIVNFWGCGTDTTLVLLFPQKISNVYWQEEFTGAPGVNGSVNVILVVSSNEIYVGGSFTALTHKGLRTGGLIMWDGSQWKSLIPHSFDNSVTINAITRDSQGNLYVGGRFSKIGSISADNVAKYNKATGQWESLGKGVSGNVSLVSALALDSQNKLYVGGFFSRAVNSDGSEVAVSNIAIWYGGAWGTVGGVAGLNSGVLTMALDSSGKLYIGGNFTATTTGTVLNCIARFDPTFQQWQAIGSGGGNGTNAQVNCIVISGTILFVGGTFTQANVGGATVAANRIAYVNTGTGAWSAIGSGTNNDVFGLALHPNTGDLYVGGRFTQAGGVSTNFIIRIATPTGAPSFNAVGGGLANTTGLNPYVGTITIEGSSILVGGAFTGDNSNPPKLMSNFGRFDGTNWGTLDGSAQANTVIATAALLGVQAPTFDGAGNMYVGGNFISAAGMANTQNIAKYDPTSKSWSSLGTNGANNTVNALTTEGSNLYAGGTFTIIGGTNANRIAMYNGTAWQALRGGANNTVQVIVVKSSTEVYVGGRFTAVNDGTNNVANTIAIAKWNGTAWSSVGGGFAAGNQVNAMAFSPNGQLYVAGTITSTNTGIPLNNLARFNSTTNKWEDVGGGTNGVIRAIAFDTQGRLYIAGNFTMAGGVLVNNIARWNGQTWESLNRGLGLSSTDIILTLAVDSQDRVYFGGAFTIGSVFFGSSLIIWDGQNFVLPGDGVGSSNFSTNTDRVNVLVPQGSFIYVGGNFTVTGDKAAQHIGKWQMP